MTATRRAALLASLAFVALLTGCGTKYATMKDRNGDDLMLLGHDPVAYFTMGKAMRGRPEITAKHDDVVYYFLSDEHRKLFVAQPEKYVPQYGAFCSSGAAYGVKLGSDPTEWRIVDGRIFFFGDVLGREAWLLDPKWNIEKADLMWPETKADGYRWQSLKRYANKVPWYKDTRTINAEWRAKHPGQPLIDYDPGNMVQNLFTKYPGWRAREGHMQPALGLVGVDPCPPACPGTESKGFGSR